MSAVPRLGYLCLSENPSDEAGRALIRQFVLVREADRMGYDDIWLGEHPGDGAWPQAAASVLLGHLAAVTSKARIGSMCLLPALRPLPGLAEDVATLDLLSKGRFALGLASGACFGPLLAARGSSPAAARARLHEMLHTLPPLLAGAPGADGLRLVPQAQLQPVPVWVAADDPHTLRIAGENGWGLMAAATHTVERVQAMRAVYLQASGGKPPPLTLARWACSADSAAEAQAIAAPYLAALAERARAAAWGADARRSTAQDPARLLAEGLIGAHADVARRFKDLADHYGATAVAIVPTAAGFDHHKHILAAFVDEVRPLLED